MNITNRKLYDRVRSKIYYKNNIEKIKTRKHLYYLSHKKEVREYSKKWKRNNQHKYLANKRRYMNKYMANRKYFKYGLTCVEVSEMVRRQHNKCKICERQFNRYVVDHNHKSKKVRSILCYSCNLALGLVREDINVLNRMVEYIKEHE